MTRRKAKKPFGLAFARAVIGIGQIVAGRAATARAAERAAQDALDKLHIAESRKKLIEAQTKMVRERTKQLPEQTDGITRRYLMTTENTENAILRQQKQEIEILKLRLQVLLLEREAGIQSADFKPIDYQP